MSAQTLARLTARGNQAFLDKMLKMETSEITYLSDGLKVKGYLAVPKTGGKYPAVILNRGGNREFSAWTHRSFDFEAALLVNAGYVVVAYPNAAKDVSTAIYDVLPGLANQLPIDKIAQAKEGAGLIGLALLLWAGTGWIGALREAMRTLDAAGGVLRKVIEPTVGTGGR